MTAEERQALRTLVDTGRRQRLAAVSDYEARRRRLAGACCPGSPVRAHNQVRAVMRMLDIAAKRNTTAPASTALDGSAEAGAEGAHHA